MSDKSYNGWSNYETWSVALWMGNDEGSQNYWTRCADECWEKAEFPPKHLRNFTREENAGGELAQWMKEELEENSPCDDASVYTDLLNAALSEVNWHEIAAHYIEEVEKEVAAE